MPDRPTTSDREQQRRDNEASRRQSGVDPATRDSGEERPEEPAEDRKRER